MTVRFELPIPPSVNHLYSTNRQGRRFVSSEGKRYRAIVKQIVTEKMTQYQGGSLENEPLSVNIKIFFPMSAVVNKGWPRTAKNRYKRVDLDNRCKVLIDSIFSALGIDDSCIHVIHMEKIGLSQPSDSERVEVEILPPWKRET